MIIADITCLSPLAHGEFGADTGNAVSIRRQPIVSLPGMPAVPCLSANALRGVLRRLLMREFFARIGADRSNTPEWDRLYGALANGGTLEKAEAVIDPTFIRDVRAALPPASVLGAFFYRWALPGHLTPRGFVWPVCQETVAAGLVETDAADLRAAAELVTEVSLVRHVDREHQDTALSDLTPMPWTIEALATGTVLQARLGFAAHTPEVERSAVAHALTLVTHLGAGAARGFGAVDIVLTGDADPAPYRAWLADAGEAQREALAQLAERVR